nr:EOG090X0439 [Lepidurus arcticus]
MGDSNPIKSERETAHPTALRQYFAQEEDDIFDKLAPVTKTEEPPQGQAALTFYETPTLRSTSSEDLKTSISASVSYKKEQEESEAPKIFSYFASSAEVETAATKDVEGKESTEKRHFWVLKPESRAVLERIKASPGTFFPEKDQLTMPGLVQTDELGDPVREQIKHFDGPTAAGLRQVPSADSVSQDVHGFRYLVQANCYRAAINLCGRLITEWGQGAKMAGHPSKHSPYSLQLWHARLSLLVLTQQYSVAQAEASAFGQLNSPDLYYEFYPELYAAQSGCMASFSFRLLLAELPQFTNRGSQALDNLSRMLVALRQILSNFEKGLAEDGLNHPSCESLEVWKEREMKVLSAMATCSISMKDFMSVFSLITKIIDKSPPSPELNAVLGRCYLQNGDVRKAQKAFSHASTLRLQTPANNINAHVDAAYIAMAQNAYTDACKQFELALQIEPENPMLLNNLSVCMLYTGRMKEAVVLLEEAIGKRPDLLLHESILLNVCTLYELESSLTVQRKLGMLRLVAQWKGDSFNIASLKLQPQTQA